MSVLRHWLVPGKKQLRRLNFLGGRPGKHEHANVLAAHYLLKQPGVERVLRALVVFRCKVIWA